MARSHHRKKHKQHLRNYQHSRDLSVKTSRAKVTVFFTLIGLALGLLVAYFAVNTTIAMIVGAIAGTAIGYLVGKRIDES